MKTRKSPAANLKHGFGVAAIVVLSIPGVLTALSPIAMPFASTGANALGSSHIVPAARPVSSPRAG